MLTTLLLNIALVVALAYLGSLGFRTGALPWPAATRWRLTGVAAGAGLLLLSAPVELAPGVRADLRLIPSTLLTLWLGPGWGLLAALPMLLLRAWQGGAGVPPAILSAAIVLLAAALLRRWSRPRLEWRRGWWQPLLIFAGNGLPLLWLPGGGALLAHIYLPLLAANLVGFWLATAVFGARLHLLRLTEQFRLQARTDPLTGLLGRRQFHDDLARALPGEHLLLLDIDHFKRINDQLGHDVGDEVLQHLAVALEQVGQAPGRGADRVYRLGGEEFAVLLRARSDGQAAAAVQEYWRALDGCRPHSSSDLRLSCGLGWASALPGEAGGALYKRADEALYSAKTAGSRRSGQGRVVFGVPGGAANGLARGSATDPGDPTAPDGRTTQLVTGADRISRYSLWQAVRTTLEIISRDAELAGADWERLLQAAVLSVPGAEAGSINVLEGGLYRTRAQSGFSDDLLGAAHDPADQLYWYAGPEAAYRAGEGRVLRGAEIARRSDGPTGGDPAAADTELYRRSGRLRELRASLCIPVLLGGEAVAHLNLESFEREDAFDDGGVELAGEFARQIGALIGVARRRERERARGRELEAANRLGLALRDVTSERAAARTLTRELLTLLDTDHVTYLSHRPELGVLRSTGARGLYQDLSRTELARGEGLAWAAAQAGTVLVSPDPRQDPPGHRPGVAPDPPPALTELAVPLLASDGALLGVLVAARPAPRRFTPADADLAAAAAGVMAVATERLRHLTQLEAAREGALLSLGLVLEVRDLETQGHTERVLSLALSFAAQLGLNPAQTEALRQGAYLHDIGKLQIPDRILLKPGKLDAEEWATMQRHSAYGHEIAGRIPALPQGTLDLILHHHERWDGSGYPGRLAGEQIPLLARAFSLVDTYDALTSERPYKRAWSVEDALTEIEAQAGRQFDPVLVRVFARFVRASAPGQPDAPFPKADALALPLS